MALSSVSYLHVQGDYGMWYQQANVEQEHDDPGLIFVLSSEAKVHACMALPAVANIRPPLQQGINMRILKMHILVNSKST